MKSLSLGEKCQMMISKNSKKKRKSLTEKNRKSASILMQSIGELWDNKINWLDNSSYILNYNQMCKFIPM